MARGVCEKCGNTSNYNFAINNGLCDSCIAGRIGELEAELEKYRDGIELAIDYLPETPDKAKGFLIGVLKEGVE